MDENEISSLDTLDQFYTGDGAFPDFDANDLVSIDTNSQSAKVPPGTDEIPSLDELLQLETDMIPLDLSSGQISENSDFAVILDPTLLFPKPTVLQTTETPESSPGGTIESSTNSSSELHTPPKILPKVVPQRRKRRKDELDYLRVKTRELEEQLLQLKSKDDDVDGHGREVEGLLSLGQGTDKVSMWRSVARRQLEGKKRAERENQKLKKMVEGKIAIIQNLEKVLLKRSTQEEAGALIHERKRVRVVNEKESAVFDRLLSQLDKQYAEMETVFLLNKQAQQKKEGEHVQVKPDGINGMFMEFLSSKIVPFGIQATATQFWRCMAQPQLKLRDGHYSLADGTEDTLSAKMAFTVYHQKHQVLKDACFAVKRFMEEDRCVFVWACETKTEGTLSAAQSMRLNDAGWTIVEKLSADDDLESTIIQSCVRVRTQLPDAMPHSHEEVMLLTEIVTGSFLENLDGIHQSVEDGLVEDAMRSTS
ncbi:hypothetical protein PHYBOEH_007528 [Phytophthora boehmeriae]|uniref:M96 mating-specific protein family n=1 Tax=Phytophthora boehmeriae TaxID=109152 RepID=A0A8T1W785_9STRA|nr:hypothetical protein PHYBOEH_007528 [Phytophthora boehmeriae]